MPARAGLNGTLAYGSGGVRTAFSVRVESIVHNLKPVFAEASGRNRRVFYPHRMSSGEFTLGLVLSGHAEREAFTSFLNGFAAVLLDPGAGVLASMEVSVPVRGFARRGVPTTGIEWGDRLGQVVFRPKVVFETAFEPLDADPDPAVSSAPPIAAVGDGAVQYFYPFGTQLSADAGAPVAFVGPHPDDWGR